MELYRNDVPPRIYRMPSKKPNAKCGISPLQLLVGCLRNTQQDAISPGYPPVFDGRHYYWRHQAPCTQGHGKIELVGTRELPPGWLDFTVMENAMQVAMREFYQSYLAMNPVNYNHN